MILILALKLRTTYHSGSTLNCRAFLGNSLWGTKYK
jgi:hypothetical protein